jgi:hypothetical protein
MSPRPEPPLYTHYSIPWEPGICVNEGMESLWEMSEQIPAAAAGKPARMFVALGEYTLRIVKCTAKYDAVEKSRQAATLSDLTSEQRKEQELESNVESAMLDVVGDCGGFILSAALGAFSGGVFFLLAGATSLTKCVVSGYKYYKTRYHEQSFLETSAGQTFERYLSATDTGLNLVTGLEKTLFKGVRSFRLYEKVITPRVAAYHLRMARKAITKFVFIVLPGFVLKSGNLLHNWPGGPVSVGEVGSVLKHVDRMPSLGVRLLSTPIYQEPGYWFRDQFTFPCEAQ